MNLIFHSKSLVFLITLTCLQPYCCKLNSLSWCIAKTHRLEKHFLQFSPCSYVRLGFKKIFFKVISLIFREVIRNDV